MTETRPASTWICTVEGRSCTSKNPHRNMTCKWQSNVTLADSPLVILRSLSADWRERATHGKMNTISQASCRRLNECADELDRVLDGATSVAKPVEYRCGECGGVEYAAIHSDCDVHEACHRYDPVPRRTCEHGVAGGFYCQECSLSAWQPVMVPTR